MSAASPPRAALLLVGNELLTGKIQEANMLPLAKMLRAQGIQLQRVVTVLDDVETIAEDLRALRARHDWVFTSGGVGPTHDDMTLAGVARAFDVPIVRHPDFEAHIRAQYGDRLKEAHLRMADVPRGATLVAGPTPSSGGKLASWPVVRIENTWVLPGVPEVFRMKLEVVRAHLPSRSRFSSASVYTNLDEGQLAPLLEQIVAAFAEVDVGSYPKWFDPSYKTKVTFDGSDSVRVDLACKSFLALLPAGEPQKVERDFVDAPDASSQ